MLLEVTLCGLLSYENDVRLYFLRWSGTNEGKIHKYWD